MTTWRAASTGLLLAMLVPAFAPSFGCTGEIETNFGPPGGLSGKLLPMGTGGGGGGSGGSGGGGGKKDAGSMDKCVYKAPKPKDAGPAEAAPATEAGDEAGPADEAGGAGGAGGMGGAGGSAGSGGGGGSAGSGGMGSDCKVSWTKDIFPNMTEAGPWQCASAACHGAGTYNPMMTDDPKVTYDNLAAYQVTLATGLSMLPFILPCSKDPAKSAFICNTSTTACGAVMPLTTNGASLLTPAQLDTIKTWIACGSIDN